MEVKLALAAPTTRWIGCAALGAVSHLRAVLRLQWDQPTLLVMSTVMLARNKEKNSKSQYRFSART